MIEIYLNGAAYCLNAHSSIHDLINNLGLAGKRLAIELNQEIIPRSQHAEIILQAADRVEVIHAVGGG